MRRKVILLTTTVVVIVGWFAWTVFATNERPALGLDLQGGVSIVLSPVKGSDLSTLDTAVSVIRSRANACAGVSEPDVTREGNTVVIDMPGAKNAENCQAVLSETAELQFRPVQGQLPYSSSASTGSTTTTVKGGSTTTTVKGGTTTTVKGATTTTAPASVGPSTTTGHALGQRAIDAVPIAARRPEAPATTVAPTTVKGATTPTTAKHATTPTSAPATATAPQSCQDGKLVTPPEQNVPTKPVILPNREKTICYALGPSVLSGKAVGSAQAIVDQNGAWIVNVHFKNDDFVNKVAKPFVNQQVAIVLDQQVISAPTINPNITGRDVTISGNFGDKSSHDLALVLRYGSLPVQFTTQTASTISPTLGKDQLRAGIIAGIIGLVLVALYMIFFYRILGLVVWLGIGLTGLTFFSLVSWLSAHRGLTLTLAGVTGIIVSVGVTVDSYVVYFERLKDEVRTGKTVRSSTDPGFRRAYRTIWAADLVSLIGAVVLYVLAAGSVRGFAYFLGLSTALDLVLAYCFMWPLVAILARRPPLVRLPTVGIGAGLDVPEVRA